MKADGFVAKGVYGGIGGIVGGLVFGALMIAAGALPRVASLVGSSDPPVGFLVHMAISLFIGATYGLIFSTVNRAPRRALSTGTLYGFVWWIVGGLALMPFFLRMPLQFANALSPDNLGGLAGHLIFGFALGATYAVVASRRGAMVGAVVRTPTG